MAKILLQQNDTGDVLQLDIRIYFKTTKIECYIQKRIQKQTNQMHEQLSLSN